MELVDSIAEGAVLNTGDKVKARKLTTIEGGDIALPAADRLVHLQFRRFAGCPICSLHMHEVASRHDEITTAGVTEVVVFHSSADRLRRYVAELPFAVVADPKRKLYDEFGVHNSIRGILNRNGARARGRGMRETHSARSLADALGPTENHLGMPADFLIATDGAVVARKYGEHADDQGSVDELLRLGTAGPPRCGNGTAGRARCSPPAASGHSCSTRAHAMARRWCACTGCPPRLTSTEKYCPRWRPGDCAASRSISQGWA